MGPTFQVLSRKGSLTVLAGAVLLAGFVAFLIGRNYLSQVEVQRYVLADLGQDLEKRAAAVAYFFSERKNDMKDVAAGREILAFFENKALGMSMEYGLKASLTIISEGFQQLQAERKLGDERIYSRIVFVDAGGTVLVDTLPNPDQPEPPGDLQGYLSPEASQPEIVVPAFGDFPLAVISMPCRFKDRYAGQIMAWLPLKMVYDHLVWQSGRNSNRSDYLFCRERQLAVTAQSRKPSPLPLEFSGQELGKHAGGFGHFFKDDEGLEWLALSTPIQDSPFALASVLPTTDVLGSTRPWHLPATLGALAALLLGGIGIISKINIRNLLLQTQLHEASRREELISEKNRELEREIYEKEQAKEAARQAKEAAESANLAKSEFLANMSHELRTPLNVIVGFTELILDRECGELSSSQEEYLGDVLQSSQHLLSLIDDILDLSKIEAGKLELDLSEVAPHDLLTRSLVIVKEKAARNCVLLSTEIGNLPRSIEVDERKLKQVLYNLLSNALKFTPQGGEVWLRAAWEEGSGVIRVCVEDTGIGLKAEDLERIFDPFEQAESGLDRRYQGTGLGLALTRRLIELHGGKIWAQSEGIGKGAAFHFLIPARTTGASEGDGHEG